MFRSQLGLSFFYVRFRPPRRVFCCPVTPARALFLCPFAGSCAGSSPSGGGSPGAHTGEVRGQERREKRFFRPHFFVTKETVSSAKESPRGEPLNPRCKRGVYGQFLGRRRANRCSPFLLPVPLPLTLCCLVGCPTLPPPTDAAARRVVDAASVLCPGSGASRRRSDPRTAWRRNASDPRAPFSFFHRARRVLSFRAVPKRKNRGRKASPFQP